MFQGKVSVFVLLLTLVFSLGEASSEEWRSYLNGRFGISVDVPAEFQAQEAPTNDDGRLFSSVTSGASLLVFGAYNVFDQSPAAYLSELVSSPDVFTSVEYQRQGRDWIVASGFLGDDIVYQKTVFSCGGEVLSTLILTYPKSDKTRMDPVVTRVSKSLKAGRGYGTPDGC